VQETRQFGMGMAAAIAIDSTIIRLLVFPSSMLLLGKSIGGGHLEESKNS